MQNFKFLRIGAAVAVLALAAVAVYQIPEVKAQRADFAGQTVGQHLKVGTDMGGVSITTGTATSTAAAATLSTDTGTITTEAVTTAGAGAATYTFTLTNTLITATSKVFVSLATTSAGTPVVTSVTPAAGTCVIKIMNAHPTAALDNTLKISFAVFK